MNAATFRSLFRSRRRTIVERKPIAAGVVCNVDRDGIAASTSAAAAGARG
jgi:hypothetical protein